jgi:hypothetical protein
VVVVVVVVIIVERRWNPVPVIVIILRVVLLLVVAVLFVGGGSVIGTPPTSAGLFEEESFTTTAVQVTPPPIYLGMEACDGDACRFPCRPLSVIVNHMISYSVFCFLDLPFSSFGHCMNLLSLGWCVCVCDVHNRLDSFHE